MRITKGRKELTTPAFFPAVSGLAFGFDTPEILRLLLSSQYPRLLVSCYDIPAYRLGNRKLIGELSDRFRNGCFVLLDSGVFESYWKNDRSWDFAKYQSAVRQIDSDFYFGYDVLRKPETDRKQFLRNTLLFVKRSSSSSRTSQYVPIIHGFDPRHLITVLKGALKQSADLQTIAVAERDCGRSLIERAQTILEVRKLIDERDEKILLHVLGCGNPISIPVLAYCGADTFDSLDWIKGVIDRESLQLSDLSHLELLDCQCKVCKSRVPNQVSKALLHNLLFYQEFGIQIQNMIKAERLWDFLVEYVDMKFLRLIDKGNPIRN